MDELVRLLAEKTGLPEDKARTAADTVIDFLKQRLPGPIGEQVNSVLSGPASSGFAGKMKEMAGTVTSAFRS